MLFVLAGVALVAVVVIGFVAVGRETGIQRARPRPAVFDVQEAVDFIADGLPDPVTARITHEDVRWVLQADADLLEVVTAEDTDAGGPRIVDEDAAVARILGAADREHRPLADADVVAILEGRLRYLRAIGAVGPPVAGPDDPTP
jgi:hypothetical protein